MAETRTGNRSEAEERLLDAVSDEQLWRHAETLAQWEKISGTPGEQEAARYLRGELEALGFDVAVHEFESLLGWPEEASLDVPGAGGVRAITHAFVPSTPESGLEADVAYVGRGQPADLTGQIALIEGMASPARVLEANRAAAAGLVFIQEDRLHEMCVSPVWGTPTTRTAGLLPTAPAVSILREDGERLKALAERGGLRVRMRTRTFWDWRATPGG